MMNSPTGRTVKYSSLVAPVVGIILNDLRKPNSLSRQLLGKAMNKLMERKYDKVEIIDITDKVEISDDTENKTTDQ